MHLLLCSVDAARSFSECKVGAYKLPRCRIQLDTGIPERIITGAQFCKGSLGSLFRLSARLFVHSDPLLQLLPAKEYVHIQQHCKQRGNNREKKKGNKQGLEDLSV